MLPAADASMSSWDENVGGVGPVRACLAGLCFRGPRGRNRLAGANCLRSVEEDEAYFGLSTGVLPDVGGGGSIQVGCFFRAVGSFKPKLGQKVRAIFSSAGWFAHKRWVTDASRLCPFFLHFFFNSISIPHTLATVLL